MEWRLLELFLVQHCAFTPENASLHVDWIQSRATLLPDWMGEVGIRMNKTSGSGPTQETVDLWNAYVDANRNRTLEDVCAELRREAIARKESLEKALAGKLSKKNRRLVEQELDRFPRDPQETKAQHRAIADKAKAEQGLKSAIGYAFEK